MHLHKQQILVHAFLVLINGVKGISIYVIALIGCDYEERPLCQLSKSLVCVRG